MGCGSKPDQEAESPYERQLRELSQQEKAKWETTYRPLENEQIRRAKMAGKDSQIELAAGRANVGAVKKISGMFQGGGFNPANKATLAEGDAFAGDALSRAVNASDAAQEAKYRGGTVQLLGIGQGQKALGMSGLKTSAALDAAENAVDTSYGNFMTDLNTNTAGAVAGMGIQQGASAGYDRGWWGGSEADQLARKSTFDLNRAEENAPWAR